MEGYKMAEEQNQQKKEETPEWAKSLEESMNKLVETLTNSNNQTEQQQVVEVPVPPAPQPKPEEVEVEEVEELEEVEEQKPEKKKKVKEENENVLQIISNYFNGLKPKGEELLAKRQSHLFELNRTLLRKLSKK